MINRRDMPISLQILPARNLLRVINLRPLPVPEHPLTLHAHFAANWIARCPDPLHSKGSGGLIWCQERYSNTCEGCSCNGKDRLVHLARFLKWEIFHKCFHLPDSFGDECYISSSHHKARSALIDFCSQRCSKYQFGNHLNIYLYAPKF